MATTRKAPAKKPAKRASKRKTTAPPRAATAPAGVRGKLATYRAKRDFARTLEPSGDRASAAGRQGLQFVIQKHAASHLHYDLRLELDGVMKSWAVPKGPSLDPAMKRLAMEVEDHPMAYNAFEGTIPRGQYGGGTVMLWDRGTYTADEAAANTPAAHARAMRDGYRAGKISFSFHGERLRGSFALVRTRGGDSGKPQWLLLKHRDGAERPGSDITAEVTASVASGRTMEEIASGSSRVWQSNRGAKGGRAAAPPPRTLAPMLASVGETMPSGEDWVFEPKYDGIRLVAYATPEAVSLITRNANDKTAQFPEIATALRALAAKRGTELVLDGEVVALGGGSDGTEPLRFQELQGRMHVTSREEISRHRQETPTAYFVFDCLVHGDRVLVHEPWTVRRAALETLMAGTVPAALRLSDVSADGGEVLEAAREKAWEGLIAKRTDAPYEPGRRSRAWQKIKLEHRQEFVVGGWTEPRNSRQHLGAILLGYYEAGRFVYAGHTGGGFSRATLADMHRRLVATERATSPFSEKVRTNERAHWTEPAVVVEVRFTEWTADGKLRHPIFLGVRDDKPPREVTREKTSAFTRAEPATPPAPATAAARAARPAAAKKASGRTGAAKPAATTARPTGVGKRRELAPLTNDMIRVLTQLSAIEDGGGTGTVRVGSETLAVTSLNKLFWPKTKQTKGDLMRYYVAVAGAILPAIADRPLVLKRFPNGVKGQAFYQQNVEQVPPGVRAEHVEGEGGGEKRRLVGGDLLTLLYTVQLGAISVDPWHGRVNAPDDADYAIIDLDPGDGVTFTRVVEVALLVRDVLAELKLRAVPKTSGASGIHIVLPLPRGTASEAARLLAELVATRVVECAPDKATIVRAVARRPAGTVYVDYLQNIRGKTVAGVYSVRAQPVPSVSTPLHWSEITASLDPTAFTIDAVPARLRDAGDLWAEAMSRPNELRRLLPGRAVSRDRA